MTTIFTLKKIVLLIWLKMRLGIPVVAIVLGFLSINSCNTNKQKSTQKSYDKDSIAINSIMNQQEIDWSNGDIGGFMNGYWNSDSLSFIGSRGLAKGWETTLQNYKKGYPDKTAMGALTFEILQLKQLSENYYYMVGEYVLQREEDAPSGFFTLLWSKINGQWKIVADHSSASE